MFEWLKRTRAQATAPLSESALQCQQLVRDGNAWLEGSDLNGAQRCYRQAVAIDPSCALAYVNLGFVLLQQQQLQGAFDALNTALALNPKSADCHYLLGSIAEQCGDLPRAASHFRNAFALKPDFELACRDACRVLVLLGQVRGARDYIAAGLALNPKFADFHFYEGNLHFAEDDLDSALASYREALVLGADYSVLHGFMGGIFLKRNDLGSSLVHLERAIELDPNNSDAHHDIGVVHIRLGHVEQAIEHQEIAITQNPTQLQAYSCLLFALGSSVSCTPQRYMDCASHYARQVHKTVRPLLSVGPQMPNLSNSPTEPRLLRIGWVSGDFRRHVNMAFVKHVLIGLSTEAVQLIAFSNNPYDDEVTASLRALMTQWHDIADLSDHDAATLIRACQVDVLIDLSGHTAHNRLPIFAWRPAPIQISWLGFFASTGLPEMDYLLADRMSVPQEWHSHFSERIWYLPETRLCMAPPETSVGLPVAPLPALDKGHITFGCFQSLSKINDTVLATWARVLSRVPHSRLRMQIRHLDLKEVSDRLRDRIAAAGIPTDRVTLKDGVPVRDYLTAHNEVDIILDTFPYPGGTTTAEALWMGVPTVTLKGKSLLARQGASMLHSAGLSDWIAVDETDYVERAVGFASDIASLARLRAQLRAQALASPLFDSQRFTVHFLAALRAMRQ